MNYKESIGIPNVRKNFVTKVFGIVGAQLLVTCLMSYLSMASDAFYKFQTQNMWAFGLAVAVSIITVIALSCFPNLSRSYPKNYYILLLFTLAESYSVSIIVG